MMVIIIAEKISSTTLSMVSAGKAILRHDISIEAQPPIRVSGTNIAMRLARKDPISNPSCVLGSVKTIRQAPNAAINKPMPISALAAQWQIE